MRDRLWTKEFALALGVAFFISTVFLMLMTTMALYAAREFGAGDAAAGLAASIYVVGALVARFFAGALVDAFGQRRVLVASLALAVVAAVAYFFADSLALLLVVRAVHGLAFGTAHTANTALAQHLIPTSRRAEGTGYLGASATLAAGLGPLIAVLLLGHAGGSALFTASVTASALALVGALFLRATPRPEPGHHAHAEPGRPEAGRRRIGMTLEPRAVPIAVFAFLVGIAYSSVLAFLQPYAETLDLASTAAVFFLVYSLVVLVLRPVAGRLQDARGDNLVMYPAILLLAAGLAVLALAHTGLVLLAAGVLIGAGWGTLISGAQAIAVSRAPISNVGKVIATFFLMLDAGTGIGPVLLGLLAGATSFSAMYGVLALVALASTGLYALVHGRRATSPSGGGPPGGPPDQPGPATPGELRRRPEAPSPHGERATPGELRRRPRGAQESSSP